MRLSRFRRAIGSLRVNIILLYSALLIVCLLLSGLVILHLFSASLYRQAEAAVDATASQVEASIDLYLNDITAYVKTFLAESRIFDEVIAYDTQVGYDKYTAYTVITSHIARLIKGNENISDVILFNDDLQINYNKDSHGYVPRFDDGLLSEIDQDLRKTEKFSIRFVAAKRSEYLHTKDETRQLLIYFPLRDYRDLTHTTLATVVFEYDLKRIEALYHSLDSLDACECYLLDHTGDIVFGALPEDAVLQTKDETTELVGSGGNRTKLTRIDISAADWRLEYYIRPESIAAQVTPLQRTGFMLLGLALLLSLIPAFFIGTHCTRPMKSLSCRMEQLAQGNFSARIQNTNNSYTEINALNTGFNRMAEEIEDLMDDVYQASLLQNQTELSAIRSKISPHFFYNALQTISSLAMLEDYDGVQQAANLLGRQFEYVVYGEAELITLREELDHIDCYLAYQNLRRPVPLRLSRNVANDLLDCSIPKLILQPLIENSVKHGFAAQNCPGEILLTAARSSDTLTLTVLDNGAGIDTDRLGKVRQALASRDISSPVNHVGLFSIHNRLRLRWGQGFGLEIGCPDTHGTLVKLTLPLQYIERREKTP